MKFKSDLPFGEGQASVGAHWRAATQSRFLPAIEIPEDVRPVFFPPSNLQYLWHTFLELSSTRTTGWVPNPISFTDMVSWCTLYGTRLAPWEVDLVLQLDRLWFKVVNDARSSRAQSRNQQ